MSYFSGMLLVVVQMKTGKDRYEDMARSLFSKKVERIVSIMNVICQMSFAVSYIVFTKETVPFIIEACGTALPWWCGQSQWGQAFWAVASSAAVFLPLSIPRTVGAFRYVTLVGVVCAFQIFLTVLFSFFFDRKTVPSVEAAWERSKLFVFSFNGIVDSVPLIVFAFMFQVNVPQIQEELERQNYRRMRTVLSWGVFLTFLLYVGTGVFGYLSFDLHPTRDLKQKNILIAPYVHNYGIIAANFGGLLTTLAAMIMVNLPCKDSIEEMAYRTGMTPRQNILVTFLLILGSLLLALVIPGIGYAITLAGCTANPIMGFFIPILFYFKATPDEPKTSLKKITCIIVFVVIFIASLLGFYNFVVSIIAFHS